MADSDFSPFEELFEIPLRNGLTKPKAVRGEGMKMVNMGEIFAHRRIHNLDMDRVPMDSRERDSSLLRAGDLLFARQSLVLSGAGKCVLFQGDNENVTFESHIIRCRLDQRKADPAFYFYLFQSSQGRSLIESIVEQVAAAGIRGSDLGRLTVPLPPLSEQKAIASILGALDDKIELNRKMNATLEAMARALFKSWFVDFDPVRAKLDGRKPIGMDDATAALFPEHLEESTLGQIPKGWKACALAELIEVVKGRSYRSEELAESKTALVTLKSFLRGGGYRTDGLKAFTGEYKPNQRVRPGDLVVAFTDVTQAADVIGKPALIRSDDRFETLVASLDVGIVRPKNKYASIPFLYCLFLSAEFQAHAYSHATGTTVLHLGSTAIPSFVTVIPTVEIAEKFAERADPIFRLINENAKQSRTLSALRDTLLPKLLSGQLTADNLNLD